MAVDGVTDGATDGVTDGATDGITDGVTDGVTDVTDELFVTSKVIDKINNPSATPLPYLPYPITHPLPPLYAP